MTAAGSNRLRIVSYNILDGGLGRLDPIYETLLYLDADVIGLVEADDPAGVAYLARKLGMEHVIAEANDSTHHVALLSRRPIERMINLAVRVPRMKKAAMEAVISAGAAPLRIIVAHLPAHFQHEDDRMAELGPLLDAVEEGASTEMPTVMVGDFNASAPWHPIDHAALKPTRAARLAAIGGTPRYDVVNEITRRGYVDALHQIHQGPTRHTFTTGYPANRVDYIWVSPDLSGRLLGGDVETGGFAPYCSDHYPIWTDIRI